MQGLPLLATGNGTLGLAARAMEAFAHAKRERRVVDFTDQEVMLLRADSELVCNALRTN